MISQMLLDARKFESEAGGRIDPDERPLFHLTARCGWMNDPNGFSYYNGKYHMFYQYYPYESHWGPMHWGHAVSSDLLSWEYLPCALAPDMHYDKDGVFSGSAAILDDGRMLLVYTGVEKTEQADHTFTERQRQCLAVGDGVDFEKYTGNPVITSDMLPADASVRDFRDPKIIRTGDGKYYLLAANRTSDNNGQILLYSSENGFNWKYESVLVRGDGRFGLMWECPDFFTLDGKEVFITSPQDMLPESFEYHSGNNTLCLIGSLDRDTMRFTEEHDQSIDYGIDFYAPQTILTEDGRRIMIGWMQNWDACAIREEDAPWAGQLSLPRELSVVDGRLYQRPTREFDALRGESAVYEDVVLDGEEQISLPGVTGRVLDLDVCVAPSGEVDFKRFEIRFACDDRHFTCLTYRPEESILKIDRKFSGSRRAIVHQRRCLVDGDPMELKLRIILDRFSIEVFINDGRQVMTATLYTELSAAGIRFSGIGAKATIKAHQINIK